jgi:TPR repeat protein
MDLYHLFHFDRAILFLAHSAILNHLESHAWLSSIFFSRHDNTTRCGTIKIDQRKAFLLAKAGHERGCIHSSALLGMHYIVGSQVSCDTRYGISLARKSSAADSCFGHLVLAHCCLKVKDYYGYESRSIRLDKAEKLYKLAAKKGCYRAKNELCKGLDCF